MAMAILVFRGTSRLTHASTLVVGYVGELWECEPFRYQQFFQPPPPTRKQKMLVLPETPPHPPPQHSTSVDIPPLPTKEGNIKTVPAESHQKKTQGPEQIHSFVCWYSAHTNTNKKIVTTVVFGFVSTLMLVVAFLVSLFYQTIFHVFVFVAVVYCRVWLC